MKKAQESVETRIFPTNQIIAPHLIEVTFSKTVHILFPSEVKYVDLGSYDIIADKATGAENVVRIKSAVKGFEGETNFSVITADGCFYSFNVVYKNEPAQLSILVGGHLAGAMGKAVWILLAYNNDWRWLTERADSPWYHSARLFRQPVLGDWRSVIAEVSLALTQRYEAETI